MNNNKVKIPRTLKVLLWLILGVYTIAGLFTMGSALKSDEPFHGWLYYWDGPFTGKVVDLDTGTPIEGAVVAGSWYMQVVFWWPRFCNAVETVTDNNGEFVLPRAWCINPWPIGELSIPGKVIVFKPGYLAYPPLGDTEEERKAYMPDWGNPRLFEAKNQYNLVKLGRPSLPKERLLTFGNASFSDDNTRKRLPVLFGLINRERRYLGLPGVEK